MIPAEFEYVAPKTLPEAIAFLQKNKDAKILSGGQSLIPLMKFRLASPALPKVWKILKEKGVAL